MKIAELIRLDVLKLSWFPSRKNARFLLAVVDNYSRKIWVFVLRQKFDAIVRIR